MRNLDLALMKEFHLTEHKFLRFQATASDALNHPNFGYPATNISAPGTVGVITSTHVNYLKGSGDARALNLSLRLQF
jgi:hypothetical protein